ncbi:hypothetical protein LCGC14_0398950 [marine sediment metagenome]|uniref:Uncharacterized protein n=1 Tax=marine sediment metagenome TaxID=412755 RepID=A0A0F9T2U7_9ZZZZ
MITLKSCVSHNTMVISEKDHLPLKKLYTQAVELGRQRVIYKRFGETIVADMESVFNVLTQLDKIVYGGK